MCTCNEVAGAISHFAVLSASSHSSGLHPKSPYCMQIFIFMRALVSFFADFFPVFFYIYNRGSSGRVTGTGGSNFQGRKGHLKVSCDRSGTGVHGLRTGLKSTLMESGMDIPSCMIVLVM